MTATIVLARPGEEVLTTYDAGDSFGYWERVIAWRFEDDNAPQPIGLDGPLTGGVGGNGHCVKAVWFHAPQKELYSREIGANVANEGEAAKTHKRFNARLAAERAAERAEAKVGAQS
jgi:hypothetical protein